MGVAILTVSVFFIAKLVDNEVLATIIMFFILIWLFGALLGERYG
jgi:hypothetical protein